MDLNPLSDDYDEIIHSSARDGHVISLGTSLERRPECINKLYEYGQSKWTVLLAACYYKHENIVRMLLTRFQPDVEVEGTVAMDNEDDQPQMIEGASPMWAAAAVGHLGIVTLLVEHGQANVNHLTKELSTPIRAACYCGDLDIVRYLIEHGADPHQAKLKNDTNLMFSAYRGHVDLVIYLVDEIRCDINEQDEDGQTALHDAIGRNFIEITKFLLQRGALNLVERSTNMTPLMLAAVKGKIDFVLAFSGYCTDLEWIEALELLGSAFAGCQPDIENVNLAVEYLTLAFETRVTKNLPKCLTDQVLEVFNNRRECETLEQFHQLVSSGSNENLYMEALIIRQRLLGTMSENYRDSIRYIGAVLADSYQYDTCLRLWFYELDLQRQHSIPFVKQLLRLFTSLYAEIYLSNYIDSYIDVLLKVLLMVNDELSLEQNHEHFDYNLITLLHLISISSRILLNRDKTRHNEIQPNSYSVLFKHIRSIVNKKYVTSETGSSLLYLCCDEKTEPLEDVTNYPCIVTTRLLILCGADVDAMNSARNTVLHILVQNLEANNTKAIIDLLCDSTSAHKDFVNNEGKSPVECKDIKTLLLNDNKAMKQLLQKIDVTSLKCHCAWLIKRCQIPYEGCLSLSLMTFVYKH